ncbi:MAG: 50S ribosomal protein L32 [Actinomycetia bacterium]|nr:50S ribosomal protein L32 [Actinomycetes bacterium]
MAVPKRKTSKSRRDKRRAQTHRIRAQAIVECARCGRPTRPHHVCPSCGTYRGREVQPLELPPP